MFYIYSAQYIIDDYFTSLTFIDDFKIHISWLTTSTWTPDILHRVVEGQSTTPKLPTNIVPTNIAWVKLSGKTIRKSLWAREFHPLKLRLCWSQTPWTHNVSRGIGRNRRLLYIIDIYRRFQNTHFVIDDIYTSSRDSTLSRRRPTDKTRWALNIYAYTCLI